MHFADYSFIFLLALILFGPKRLPEIGRQVGRLMMEFRRASNEFKMQMDEELRNLEEDDRRKKLEAAAAETGTIAEPHALPSGMEHADSVAEAEDDPDLIKTQPYVPPLPGEECIDPVDLLDKQHAADEDAYAEEYDDEYPEEYAEEYADMEDPYSSEYDEPDENGPEISAGSEKTHSSESQPDDSQSAETKSSQAESSQSYLPSDEPAQHVTPETADSEKPKNPQDPVRPESDSAIRHA